LLTRGPAVTDSIRPPGAFHLTRALQAAGGDFDNETRYVELLADFEADFVDLRNQNPTPDCLHPDTSIGYPAGQELADEIRKSGHNGLVYPSVRHANGVCLAAFWPGLIQNFQQGESWILKWAGSPTPTIMRAANAV
jgi:RES domain